MNKNNTKILNWGIQQHQSPLEQRRVRLLNIVAWIGVISNSIYIPYTIYVGSLLAESVNIVGTFIFLIIIFLNRKYRYHIARVSACIAFPIYFLIMSLGIGPKSGLEYYLLFISILPILFFDKKIEYLPLFFLNLILFMIIKIGYLNVVPIFGLRINEEHEYIVYLINLTNVFIVLLVVINSFKLELLAYQKSFEIKTKKLAVAYKKIQSSIKYAQKIQGAFLGNPEKISRFFPQSFIFFKPKDVVSGDFYWMTENKQKNLTFFVAADCTGHGVPGAFMTVMGANFLDEIVNGQEISEPAEILNLLDYKITASFSQLDKNQKINDGMDLALLCYDQQKQEIRFSGAKSPLYLARGGELQQFSGSKFPIGSQQYNNKQSKNFQTTSITIHEGDTVYLASDGFQDQFGGQDNKKYLKKNFRELLLKISKLPIQKQKIEITEELEKWKGNRVQTDDILVTGLKF